MKRKMWVVAVLIGLILCGLDAYTDEIAGWQGRSGHRMAAFEDALFISGGLYAFEKNFFFNDLWVSKDGAVWNRVEMAPAYSPSRQLHGFLVFQEHLWVLGGQSDVYLNDVWRSADGSGWETVTASAAWTPRRGMAALVHNDRMFLLGGEDGDREYNSDVWVSDDGASWELLTGSPGWRPRWEHAAVSFNNAIFVLGGAAEYGKFNDVWRSSDGVTWTKMGTLPVGVRGHCAEVFRNKIFVFGGVDENDKLLNQILASDDGTTWEVVEEYALWPARTRHASTVQDRQLWLAGGTTETGDSSEVWHSRDGVDWQDASVSGCGCTCSSEEPKTWKAFLGDLLLIGISLLVVLQIKK